MPRRTRTASLFALVACALFAAPAARAEWEPPKDGLLTEKQVTEYIGATKDWVGAMQAAGKAVEKNQAAALAVIGAADARFKQILAQHGFTEPEYRWVGDKVWEARGAVMVDELMAQQRKGVADAQQKAAADAAALKARIAALEQAVKSGRRVMTEDEKKAAIESAKGEVDAATEAAKAKDEEAKAAAAEAAKYDATAKAAEALAAKPPADVPADERNDYVATKKQEAADAVAAAKEQRTTEAEARKEAAANRAKAAAFAARMKDPEATPADEVEEVKKQNAEKLAAAQAELKQNEEGAALLKQAAEQVEKGAAEGRAKVDPKNLEIVRKHVAAFDAMWGTVK